SQRPFAAKLAGVERSDSRQHCPRLSGREQKLQPVVFRHSPMNCVRDDKNGARPSSGAATLARTIALDTSNVFRTHSAAAPEDGRTPALPLGVIGSKDGSGNSHGPGSWRASTSKIGRA